MAEPSTLPPPEAVQPTISDPTDGVAAAPAAPQEPENVSETLYIQNLNEKIKIPGIYHQLNPLFS